MRIYKDPEDENHTTIEIKKTNLNSGITENTRTALGVTDIWDECFQNKNLGDVNLGILLKDYAPSMEIAQLMINAGCAYPTYINIPENCVVQQVIDDILYFNLIGSIYTEQGETVSFIEDNNTKHINRQRIGGTDPEYNLKFFNNQNAFFTNIVLYPEYTQCKTSASGNIVNINYNTAKEEQSSPLNNYFSIGDISSFEKFGIIFDLDIMNIGDMIELTDARGQFMVTIKLVNS